MSDATVTINGEKHRIPSPMTAAELLAHLEIHQALVAMELNREVVTRSVWAETAIRDGDEIEIVHFVGGG